MNAVASIAREGSRQRPKWYERAGWLLLLLGQVWGLFISLLLVVAPLTRKFFTERGMPPNGA